MSAPDVDKSNHATDRITANETDRAQGDGEADLPKENNEGECPQEAHARPQQENLKGEAEGNIRNTPQVTDKATNFHVTEQSAPDNTERHRVAASNRSLMVRDPGASFYEVFSLCFIYFCEKELEL